MSYLVEFFKATFAAIQRFTFRAVNALDPYAEHLRLLRQEAAISMAGGHDKTDDTTREDAP